MAAIDDKVAALEFNLTTKDPPERVAQVIAGAEASSSTSPKLTTILTQGPKLTLTQGPAGRTDGVFRNWAGLSLAEFTVQLEPAPDGGTIVRFSVSDYLRIRDTLIGFIPVSPWKAPGYTVLASFSQYLRSKLSSDTSQRRF